MIGAQHPAMMHVLARLPHETRTGRWQSRRLIVTNAS